MPRVRTDASVLRDMVYTDLKHLLPADITAQRFQGWGPNGREFYIEFSYGRQDEFGFGDLCFAVDDQHLWLIRQGRFRASFVVNYEMGIGNRLVFDSGYSLDDILKRIVRATFRVIRDRDHEQG